MRTTDFITESLSFWAAIGCFVWGVKSQKIVVITASLFCLLGASLVALELDGSSSAFEIIAGYFILFSIVAFALSRHLSEVGRVSKNGLQGLATLILILGILCLGIL